MNFLVKSLIIDSRFSHFFVTGVTGVLLNLLITWSLTEFVFGVERYIIGYLFGAVVNLTYNFIFHTILTFHTKERHVRRFFLFILHGILSTIVQITIVNTLTNALGKTYYLFIIATVIFLLSVVNFLFFKHVLFNEAQRQMGILRI